MPKKQRALEDMSADELEDLLRRLQLDGDELRAYMKEVHSVYDEKRREELGVRSAQKLVEAAEADGE